MKRFTALLCAAALCFSLTACVGKNGQVSSTDDTTAQYSLPTPIIKTNISLPYTSADKISPYDSESDYNRALLPLIFESLYTPTADGKGKAQLSSSGEASGKVATVTLKENVLFSDGTALTADDVASSFRKAKSSKWYSDELSNVQSASASGNTVTFHFSVNDPMALNVLDFPVARAAGSGYIGTGKYSVDKIGGKPYLAVNENHHNFDKAWNSQLALYDMAGVSTEVFAFKSGAISVFSDDLSGGAYHNLSSQTVSVPINNFVYLGVNMNRSGASSSADWIRRAINIGLDRKSVAAASFLGQTEPVSTPFRGSFYQLTGQEVISLSGDSKRTAALLKEHGFGGSSSPKISLLVCSDNPYKVKTAAAVKVSLASLGFSVTVNKLKGKDFESAVKSGSYDLYLGEMTLTNDCDLSAFFSSGGAAHYGIERKVYDIYDDYVSGKDTITSFIENFYTDVPFIPLFYRKAVVSLNPALTGAKMDSSGIYTSACLWRLPSADETQTVEEITAK